MRPDTLFSASYSPSLCRVNRAQTDGLQKWLGSKKYNLSVDSGRLLLHPHSFEVALESWAADTIRLLSAGRETLSVVAKSKYSGKSIAWASIQTYYAAFYYAHVILRLNRRSLTYLTTANLLNVRRICDAFGLDEPFSLNTSQYVLDFLEGDEALVMTKKTDGDGTHEGLWQEFIQSVQSASALSRFNFPDFEEELSNLERWLVAAASCTATGTGYISSLRNQVQYTQLHGAWHPYSSTMDLHECRRRCASILNDSIDVNLLTNKSNDTATKFSNASLLICWAAEHFVRRIAKSKKSVFYCARIPTY